MIGKVVGAAAAMVVAAVLIWLPMHRRPPRLPIDLPPAPVVKPPTSVEKGLDVLRQFPGVQATKTSFRHNDKDGKPLLEVTGDKVTNEADSDQMCITGVKATMYEEGKPAARFAAKEVRISYVKDHERLTFIDDVRIRSELRDAELRAGRVEYELNTKKLVATGGIRFTQTNIEFESPELRADLALGNVKLVGKTQGSLTTRRGL